MQSIKEYRNKITLYFVDIKNDLRKSDTWKNQLPIAINFVSSKDNDEERIIHPSSHNIQFMIYDNKDKIIEGLFESVLNRYQIRLETAMRGSYFIFDCTHLLCCKCNKINPNQ